MKSNLVFRIINRLENLSKILYLDVNYFYAKLSIAVLIIIYFVEIIIVNNSIMVKVDNSQGSCQLSVPDNLETDLILLHGLEELMKIQYNKNSDDTWTIRSLDEQDKYIGEVSAKLAKRNLPNVARLQKGLHEVADTAAVVRLVVEDDPEAGPGFPLHQPQRYHHNPRSACRRKTILAAGQVARPEPVPPPYAPSYVGL